MKLEKHSLNVLPEMSADEKAELRDNLDKNGFDENFPIFTYEGKVLDGWNRYLLCEELHIEAFYIAKDDEFAGNPEKAIDFIRQVNTRRNLTSSQKAALAVECEDLINKIRSETEQSRREKQGKSRKEQNIETGGAQSNDNEDLPDESGETEMNDGKPDEKTTEYSDNEDDGNDDDDAEDLNDGDEETDEHQNKTASKLAAKFDTNRTYVNDAAKLKEKHPDEFEKVKAGEKSIAQAKKDVSTKTRSFFEEIAHRFADYAKIIKKLQEFGDGELVSNHHDLYPEIMKVNVEDFERRNAEIATYILCEECGGTGCAECGEKGFTKPIGETGGAEEAI